MKHTLLCLSLFLMGLLCTVLVLCLWNQATPVLENGGHYRADGPAALSNLTYDPGLGGYSFTFSSDTQELMLLLSDSGPITVQAGPDVLLCHTPHSPYSRTLSLPLSVCGETCPLLFRLPQSGRRLLSGPEFTPKLLLLPRDRADVGRYAALEAFIEGLYAMLIFCALILYGFRPREHALLALVYVSLSALLVQFTDRFAGSFGLSQQAFSALRSSLFLCPAFLTAFIPFFLAGPVPRFTLRTALFLTLFIVLVQLLCPYNLNYVVRILLLLALLPFLCRTRSRGALLLSLGCGISEGARLFIYLLNTLSLWPSGAPAMLLRLTQLGYLCQLMLCMFLVLRRFACKFNEADELILSLDRKVSERTRDLSQANAELARAKDSEHEVMVNILHDLRTPIFHLQGCCDMLTGTKEDQEVLSIARERVRYLQALTDNSFLAARLKDGSLPFQFQPADLIQLCRFAFDSARTAAQDRGLSFQLDLPERLIAVTDPLRFRQVIENLTGNAVRHARAGTPVQARLWEEDGKILFTLSNRTDTLHPEQLPSLFERFSHGPDASSTGLGLYIAREMARGLGGWLSARLDGDLVVFTLQLPHTEEREDNAHEAHSAH